MIIDIRLEKYEIEGVLKECVEKAIEKDVYPKIEDYLKKAVSSELVGEIILDRIKKTLEYSSLDRSMITGLSTILKDRVQEISDRITDEDLKKIILQRFFVNFDK